LRLRPAAAPSRVARAWNRDRPRLARAPGRSSEQGRDAPAALRFPGGGMLPLAAGAARVTGLGIPGRSQRRCSSTNSGDPALAIISAARTSLSGAGGPGTWARSHARCTWTPPGGTSSWCISRLGALAGPGRRAISRQWGLSRHFHLTLIVCSGGRWRARDEGGGGQQTPLVERSYRAERAGRSGPGQLADRCTRSPRGRAIRRRGRWSLRHLRP
jgi:hypothetical protein